MSLNVRKRASEGVRAGVPVAVPLLAPHRRGGTAPPPLWEIHGHNAFQQACAWSGNVRDWATVVLVPGADAPDPEMPAVPGLLQLEHVPHDPHVAVTSQSHGGSVEWGTVVLYQPMQSMAVWGVEYTTALNGIVAIRTMEAHSRPQDAFRPEVRLRPELSLATASMVGTVATSPHWGVAWLEPHTYC